MEDQAAKAVTAQLLHQKVRQQGAVGVLVITDVFTWEPRPGKTFDGLVDRWVGLSNAQKLQYAVPSERIVGALEVKGGRDSYIISLSYTREGNSIIPGKLKIQQHPQEELCGQFQGFFPADEEPKANPANPPDPWASFYNQLTKGRVADYRYAYRFFTASSSQGETALNEYRRALYEGAVYTEKHPNQAAMLLTPVTRETLFAFIQESAARGDTDIYTTPALYAGPRDFFNIIEKSSYLNADIVGLSPTDPKYPFLIQESVVDAALLLADYWQWKYGPRMYNLSEDLMLKLALTSITKNLWDDVKAPFPAFTLLLPTKYLRLYREQGVYNISAIGVVSGVGLLQTKVSHDIFYGKDVEESLQLLSHKDYDAAFSPVRTPVRSLLLRLYGTSETGHQLQFYYKYPTPPGTTIEDTLIMMARVTDVLRQRSSMAAEYTPKVFTEEDGYADATERVILRIVLSVLFYLRTEKAKLFTSNEDIKPDARWERTARKPPKTKRPRKLGLGITPINPLLVKPAQAALVGRPLSSLELEYPLLVTGHPKRQPYGPGSKLRKEIYVQPYWKGLREEEEEPPRAETGIYDMEADTKKRPRPRRGRGKRRKR